jgi:hypothetical protein
MESPRLQHHLEVAVREGHCPARQHLFVAGERIRDVDVPGVGEQPQRRFGEEAVGEAFLDDRHALDTVGQVQRGAHRAGRLAGGAGEPGMR